MIHVYQSHVYQSPHVELSTRGLIARVSGGWWCLTGEGRERARGLVVDMRAGDWRSRRARADAAVRADGQRTALDLFCGGGAAEELMKAGFYVVGIDSDPRVRKSYPGRLVVGDVFDLAGLRALQPGDLVWASPRCQRFSVAVSVAVVVVAVALLAGIAWLVNRRGFGAEPRVPGWWIRPAWWWFSVAATAGAAAGVYSHAPRGEAWVVPAVVVMALSPWWPGQAPRPVG